MASYNQNPTNRKWSVRFYICQFGKYKQKRLSGFKTKKEAEKAYNEFIAINPTTKKSNLSDMLFRELYNNYLVYISKNLKVSSIYDRKNLFNLHVLPFFADMKIFAITKKDIYNWQLEISDRNYSYNFKKKLRTSLSAIFKYAVYYFDLPANPVLQVEPFKRTEAKKEVEVWSLDEFSTFIKEVEDFEFKVFFTFLYLTGCRKGEAFALTWDKIDFQNKIVTIDSNITRKVENKPYEVVPTKTYERRKLLIPDNLVNLLLKLKENQNDYKITNFVFGETRPLAEQTTTRKFENAIKKTGVKKLHLHCLRHSHASFLISQGESIVMVSKRLGHGSIEQTLNTYSHLMPNEENKMVSKLNFVI